MLLPSTCNTYLFTLPMTRQPTINRITFNCFWQSSRKVWFISLFGRILSSIVAEAVPSKLNGEITKRTILANWQLFVNCIDNRVHRIIIRYFSHCYIDSVCLDFCRSLTIQTWTNCWKLLYIFNRNCEYLKDFIIIFFLFKTLIINTSRTEHHNFG